MPRYFFDFSDLPFAFDLEGSELPDEEAALRELRRTLAHMLGDEVEDGGAAVVEATIRRQNGSVAFTVRLSLEIHTRS